MLHFIRSNFVLQSPSLYLLYIIYNCLSEVTNQVKMEVGGGEWWLINKRKIYWIMVLSEAGGQTIRY